MFLKKYNLYAERGEKIESYKILNLNKEDRKVKKKKKRMTTHRKQYIIAVNETINKLFKHKWSK